MKIDDARWIRAALPQGRTLYRYYKDRYSLQLLRYAVPVTTPVHALRDSPVAGLLQKPRVREVLAHCDGRLTPSLLKTADGDPNEVCYLLTLGLWRHLQTSRPGCNLVLQLNFARSHDVPFRRLLRPEDDVDPFNVPGHPTLRDAGPERRYTLAWSRIDLDLNRDEALVEEVQTDWLRVATRLLKRATQLSPELLHDYYGVRTDAERLRRYHHDVLTPQAHVWDEAMLSATLFFLREELGIRRIYYHTPESGRLLKRITDRQPPQSLYTTLPRRFCFREDDAMPDFIARERRVQRLRSSHRALRMHVLQV